MTWQLTLPLSLGARALLALSLAACGSHEAYFTQPTSNPPPGNNPPGGNSNINLGGAQDFGYFRRLLDAGQVPQASDLDAAGFFAEHHTPLPEPSCGQRICLQAMIGVMANLMDGRPCMMLQLGLNSPITIDPAHRPPLSLVAVIDVSGSMAQGGKIDFVRSGLAKMVNELADDDRLALVTYSTGAQVILPMTGVGGRRNEILELVQRLTPGGSTNIWAGLELGYRQIDRQAEQGRQARVLLLSDGQPTEGERDPQRIIGNSFAYNSEGLGLTTIGLGTDFNLALMRGLAEQADGNFYFVEDATAVEEVFTEELAYFTVPIAFDLQLDLTTGQDFVFTGSYGSSFFRTTAGGGRLEVPSVFLAHRRAHDDQTSGRRGGGSALLVEFRPSPRAASVGASELAVLDLSFRDPESGQRVSDQVRVEYPFAAGEVPELGVFDNDLVEKSFVMLNLLLGMQQGVELFHRGGGSQAVGTLRRLAAAAADYEDGAHGGLGDEDIRADLQVLEQLMAVMLRNGAVDPAAPPPANPWPRD